MLQETGVAQYLELLADVDSLTPDRSALAGLHLRSNSFRRFPSGSNVADVAVVGVEFFQFGGEGVDVFVGENIGMLGGMSSASP